MNFASYREEGPTSLSLGGFEGNDDDDDDDDDDDGGVITHQ